VALDAIADQPRAVALLRRALETDRVAHAYAFVGAPGSGRTTTALAFAAALLCERGGCGAAPAAAEERRCQACRLAAARQHPDLHLIVPTPPEKNPRGPRAIRLDAIRDVERRAALRPALGRRKIVVVDDAERMTGEAPQAFLKTLEEPPARTVMVLVLARPRALPATVLSRCQIVRFAPRGPAVPAAARAEALDLLAEVRAKGAEALFRRSQAVDREAAERLVDAYWGLFRDLLLAKTAAPARLLAEPDAAPALAREAAAWTVEECLRALETCREAWRGLAVNVTPRLTVEIILSRLVLRAA
jgi:DNA polymerase III subunit delta'